MSGQDTGWEARGWNTRRFLLHLTAHEGRRFGQGDPFDSGASAEVRDGTIANGCSRFSQTQPAVAVIEIALDRFDFVVARVRPFTDYGGGTF